MKLTLSNAAMSRVRGARAAGNIPDNYLFRFKVRGAGCGGFSYDLYFDIRRDDDVEVEANGVRVVVDSASVPYLNASTLDATISGFVVTDNPNAGNYCACGASFAPKF